MAEITGQASYYGPGFYGNTTSQGDPNFTSQEYTAAIQINFREQFGAGNYGDSGYAKVTNLSTGKSIRVKINDVGPLAPGRVIDLSEKSFKALSPDGGLSSGILNDIKVEYIELYKPNLPLGPIQPEQPREPQRIEVIEYDPNNPPIPSENPDATTSEEISQPEIPGIISDIRQIPISEYSNQEKYSPGDLQKRKSEILDRLKQIQNDGATENLEEERNNLISEFKQVTDEIIKRDVENCITNQTDKSPTLKDTPDCERWDKSTALIEARQKYQTEVPLADPCGTSTFAQINTHLLSFFKTLKKIKNYAQFYVNGTINKIQNITQLIRNTAKIIGSVLKILIQRVRDWIIGKIRAGIQDLIDQLLPTVTKVIKNTVIQQIIDTILCKFKDIMNGLVEMIGDFLFELVGKIVNVPFCAATQWTSAIINKLSADIDRAIGPLLDQINDVLSGIANVAGSVFEAIDFILGFESFLCQKPKCPEVKSWFGDPRSDGPSPTEIDNFNNNFLNVPSEGEIIESATGWIENLPIFGGTLGQYDGTIPDSITQCDTAPFRCGPPSVQIFGGGGIGAVGNAVVNKFGQIMGVDLTFGGSNYSSPPFVSFIDPCENGNYASGYAEINDEGQVINIVMTNNGSGYLNRPSGLNEFDLPIPPDPSGESVNDYVTCLTGFDIISTGIGYKPSDIVKITPEIENIEAVVKITSSGQILDIQLTNIVCGLTNIPEIDIESDTGDGVIIRPILDPININDETDDDGDGDGDGTGIDEVIIRPILDPININDGTGDGDGTGGTPVTAGGTNFSDNNTTNPNDQDVLSRVQPFDPNANPTISIDSISKILLNTNTRKEIIGADGKTRVVGDNELKFTTSNGQINIVRVIDCVK